MDVSSPFYHFSSSWLNAEDSEAEKGGATRWKEDLDP